MLYFSPSGVEPSLRLQNCLFQLLEQYKKSDPWVRRSEPKNGVQNRPEEYDVSELEGVLFSEFLRARFTPRYEFIRLDFSVSLWLT
jgi:hypothetical protein